MERSVRDLEALRKSVGFRTQQSFATELGVSRSAVAMWDRMESFPQKASVLIKIIQVTGCSLEDLVLLEQVYRTHSAVAMRSSV